ncbi:MAG TPA: hypothetical protein VKA21_06190 [Candidatus Binatia bacterium]|nr:hypothetical protein [Candidatus Binatia bacterium]
MARALGVVLVRDRRPEHRHDAVAGELVDEPAEALDPLRQKAEEALHEGRPLLRVEAFGELHRAAHVGEEHRDLLPLALDRETSTEHLRRRHRRRAEAAPTAAAELLARLVLRAAGGTRDRQAGAALRAEPAPGPVIGSARVAAHRPWPIPPGVGAAS